MLVPTTIYFIFLHWQDYYATQTSKQNAINWQWWTNRNSYAKSGAWWQETTVCMTWHNCVPRDTHCLLHHGRVLQLQKGITVGGKTVYINCSNLFNRLIILADIPENRQHVLTPELTSTPIASDAETRQSSSWKTAVQVCFGDRGFHGSQTCSWWWCIAASFLLAKSWNLCRRCFCLHELHCNVLRQRHHHCFWWLQHGAFNKRPRTPTALHNNASCGCDCKECSLTSMNWGITGKQCQQDWLYQLLDQGPHSQNFIERSS